MFTIKDTNMGQIWCVQHNTTKTIPHYLQNIIPEYGQYKKDGPTFSKVHFSSSRVSVSQSPKMDDSISPVQIGVSALLNLGQSSLIDTIRIN